MNKLMPKDILTRTATGIFYVGLIFLCTTASAQICLALIVAFALLCYYEFQNITHFSSLVTKLIGLAAIFFSLYYFGDRFLNDHYDYSLNLKNLVFPVIFFLGVIVIFFFDEEIHNDQAKLIIAVSHIAIPFGLSLSLARFEVLENGNTEMTWGLFLIFCLIWVNDIFAYLFGNFVGKTPLAPKISPKKSVEGFLGGFVFTILLGFFIEKIRPGLIGNYIIISLLISIAGPLGDLAASKIKRLFGAKDSGNILPGHGGFLDRLDSFIFTVPCIYLYFILIQSIR